MAALASKLLLPLIIAVLVAPWAEAAPLRTKSELEWLRELQQQAIDNGISPAVVSEALDDFAPNPRVLRLDRKQPEKQITFDSYVQRTVSAWRLRKGAETLNLYRTELEAIEARTGVPPQVVVALLGIESSYGQNMGNFDVIYSLATLVYDGRRDAFFRGQLFNALRILEREKIPPRQLRGSWAGAMGQCQFMPSTYLRHAIDGNGDGRIDIWNEPLDAMASAANYLAAEGWKRGLPSATKIKDGKHLDQHAGLDKVLSLQEWLDKGVLEAESHSFPKENLSASLVLPLSDEGASFLVYDNFRALMRWNRSTYFALTVGLMADEIASLATR